MHPEQRIVKQGLLPLIFQNSLIDHMNMIIPLHDAVASVSPNINFLFVSFS